MRQKGNGFAAVCGVLFGQNFLTVLTNWLAWHGLARNRSGLTGEPSKMFYSPTVPLTKMIFWPGRMRLNCSIICIPFIECIA